jgi:Homeodomain-like domain
VNEGLSTRDIAERLHCCQATVRHWLEKHDVQTRTSERRRLVSEAVASGVVDVEAECRRHGFTPHRIRPERGLVCLRCRSEAVSRRRRKVKRILVAEAGGACCICGYARSAVALEFHHVDPATKSFSIGAAGVTRSLERARQEARKCVLLCANCHAEVEAGSTQLPRWVAQYG